MLGHHDVFEPARRRSVSCVQENKLFTSPPFTSKSWQTIQPQIWGGGSEEESLVTRQPLCHLPRHAKISHLPLHAQGTRLHLKASSAGLMENKTITETQLNYVAPGKKVWWDYIAFSLMWEREKVVLLRRRWALLKAREQNPTVQQLMFSTEGLLHWNICDILAFCEENLKLGEGRAVSNKTACQVELEGDCSARKSGSSAWATCPLNNPCPEGSAVYLPPASTQTHSYTTHTHTRLAQNMAKKLQTLLLKRTSSSMRPLHTIFKQTHTHTHR